MSEAQQKKYILSCIKPSTPVEQKPTSTPHLPVSPYSSPIASSFQQDPWPRTGSAPDKKLYWQSQLFPGGFMKLCLEFGFG